MKKQHKTETPQIQLSKEVEELVKKYEIEFYWHDCPSVIRTIKFFMQESFEAGRKSVKFEKETDIVSN